MTYRADTSIKINTEAVGEFKKIAKDKEARDFDDIQTEIAKRFNLTEAEATKVRRKAEFELAMEIARACK